LPACIQSAAKKLPQRFRALDDKLAIRKHKKEDRE
jgi:hypothetical protein